MSQGRPAAPGPWGIAEGLGMKEEDGEGGREDALEALAGNISERQLCSSKESPQIPPFQRGRLLADGPLCEGPSC